ncbi:hypothetical protein [Oceaniovalibus sp. ACAM 378]|uniref:hypothetical protein n=1 Tax=Oceaniovalibus sp. ACAM 378 TaxID=2599923 RepID=UPI0011D34ED2|nr:hypothetical protein [Oceaniovalibus sp. ACAM 378]TYB89705.1 hypothetical protein FQ320_06150 [Oceaniovalibus sp. ACAM 378]
MDALIWSGAALSLSGLVALIWCIVAAMRVRREGLDDAAMRARLQRLVAVNMGALALSVLGLMMITVGIFLA